MCVYALTTPKGCNFGRFYWTKKNFFVKQKKIIFERKTQKPIYISPLNYKGQKRIKITFDGFDKEAFTKAKSINGFAYSKTYKCYHLPYNTETYKELKKLFDKIIINNTQAIGAVAAGSVSPQTPTYKSKKILVHPELKVLLQISIKIM